MIDHGGRRIRIATPRGDIEARAVIVTVPTDVLAAGVPRFAPELPDKIAAAQALPLGIADKVYLRLTGGEDIPKDAHLYGAIDRVAPAATICGRWGARWSKAISAANSPASWSRKGRRASRASPSTSSRR